MVGCDVRPVCVMSAAAPAVGYESLGYASVVGWSWNSKQALAAQALVFQATPLFRRIFQTGSVDGGRLW